MEKPGVPIATSLESSGDIQERQSLESVQSDTYSSDRRRFLGGSVVGGATVLKADPEEIHILDLRGREREFEESRKSWGRFPALRAVRQSRILRLRGEDFARCTPRLLRALKGLG